MAAEESTSLSQNADQARHDLATLRTFQGHAREFWSQYVACVGHLTTASKVLILLRPPPTPSAAPPAQPPPTAPEAAAVVPTTTPAPAPAPPVPEWRRIGEWVPVGGPSRLLVAFTMQSPASAERCANQGSLLLPLEPVPARGMGHYVIAARLILARGEEVCVALCLVSEVNEAAARECLLRLSLAADVPASYQNTLAGHQARTDVQKFASALDLMAQVNAEKRFLAAALAFCNATATHFRCNRVSIGWLEGGYVRLRAMSRTEKFDRQMAAAQALEKAMEECLDQDDEIVWPAPESATVVTRDHEAFARDQKVSHLASLPLRLDHKATAVVTCERQNEPFSTLELQELRLSLDQGARRLSELKHHDRWFGARWATATREAASKLVGPQHTWAKVIGLLVTILLAVFLLVKVDYRVEGTFLLRSDDVAFLTVPFDGFIDEVLVRTGDHVAQDKPLLKLETADLELEESTAIADVNRYQREAEKARASQNLAEMRIAEALASQSQARLDLIRYRLNQAAIKTPFDGIVVEGDLRERVGAPVKQGDALFKVARIDTLYVEAEVNERDVHEILGRDRGEIAFVSQPNLKFPVRIERVEPAAIPKKEGNVFLVRCRFEEPIQNWWRPGMSGLCKLHVEKRTLVWIFTHRTVDFVRMMLWW